MFRQRQELHPKLANSERHLARVGSEDGFTSCPHVRRACELELIIFGLAHREFVTAAGVKTVNVEVQFVLRLTQRTIRTACHLIKLEHIWATTNTPVHCRYFCLLRSLISRCKKCSIFPMVHTS